MWPTAFALKKLTIIEVAKIVALIKKAFPSYTADQVERAIINTAIDLGTPGKDSLYGSGRISATAASTGSGTCTGTCGTLVAFPASCTKGVTASNPNCDITLNYTSSGVSPSALIIKRNGINLQTLTTANGSITNNNPVAGIYVYSLQNNIGAIFSSATVYVYNAGTLTSPWLSCTLKADTTNPTCNIALSYNVSGGVTGNVTIYKDGILWKSVLTPAGTVSDISPTAGTHTYTLRDGSGTTQISRVVIRINPATVGLRVITSISPTSARVGDLITITGTNLGSNLQVERGHILLQILDKDRDIHFRRGDLNPANTQGTWTVFKLQPGKYTLRVSPNFSLNNVSNEVNLTILP